MNTLYDMVVQSSSQSQQLFFFRICRSSYKTYERHIFHTICSEPNPHEYFESRYAKPLKRAIMEGDLVLDTWTADQVLFKYAAKFSHDKWTKELVQRLQFPMRDVKLNS